MAKTFEISLKRSPIGKPKDQKATVAALGLRRFGKTIVHNDNPQVRGMIFKVQHLLNVRVLDGINEVTNNFGKRKISTVSNVNTKTVQSSKPVKTKVKKTKVTETVIETKSETKTESIVSSDTNTTVSAGEIFVDENTGIKSDTLQIVEGIGPKIGSILKDAGISDWAALASAPIENLKAILEEAGPRYKIHNPTTWPQQADLAAKGQWDALIQLQTELDGGNETDKGPSPAKVNKFIKKKK